MSTFQRFANDTAERARRLSLVSGLLAMSAIALSGLVAAGCGSDAADELSRQQQLREERRQGAQEERLRQLERDLSEQKRERRTKQARGGTSKAAPLGSGSAPPQSSSSDCGGGLSAGPNTSCAFASSVRDAYLGSGGGNTTIQAYSPVTHETYSMSCTGGAPTVCRGGNDASVSIR